MRVNDLFLPLSRQVVQLQTNLQGLVDDMRRIAFHQGSTPEASTFSRMVRDLYPYLIQKKFTAIENLLARQKVADAELMTELKLMLSKARTTFDRLTQAKDRDVFEATYAELKNSLLSISKRVDDECQKITKATQEEGRENVITSLGLSLLVVLFGLAAVAVSSRVLRPLPALIQSLKKIRGGDFHQSLKVKNNDKDEVAVLAREYNRMLEALRERDEKIQKQQQELVQSERLAAVGQLSAQVVHEIRNPLNSMSLNVDWLSDQIGSGTSEVQDTLKSISREIDRLNQITESYLVRARVPSQEDQRAPVNEVLKEIIDFEREIEQEGIRIETELADQEIFVRTDRSKLKQAFINVLRNAREAMPRGGLIRISTEIRDNISRILFIDSGHGMSEKVLKETFRPFFTTKPNGTGLGLTLTKEIVEEANGKIDCLSQLGKGTTFVFQFPI
jgi:two-component system, NtrC family, sensor kinase